MFLPWAISCYIGPPCSNDTRLFLEGSWGPRGDGNWAADVCYWVQSSRYHLSYLLSPGKTSNCRMTAFSQWGSINWNFFMKVMIDHLIAWNLSTLKQLIYYYIIQNVLMNKIALKWIPRGNGIEKSALVEINGLTRNMDDDHWCLPFSLGAVPHSISVQNAI